MRSITWEKVGYLVLFRTKDPTATEKIALDNTLVAPEARLIIGKCNSRISFSKPQREATYQVTFDALKLSPCYPAFLITAEVPEIYLHQFWNSFNKIDNHYSTESMPYPRFTKIIINHFISQNKSISMRNKINLHTVRDDSILGTLKYVSKTEEHQVYEAVIPKEMINEDILNSTAHKTYYAYASSAKEPKKARKFKKPASPKLKTVPVSPKEPTKKPDKKTIPVKKSSKSRVEVIIKDTLGVSVSKKKAPVKGKRSKGIEIIYDVALSEAAQLKEAPKRSKKYFHISQVSGSSDGTNFKSGVPDEQQRKTSGIDKGTGTKPGVSDVPKHQSKSDDKSWGDSEEDDNDDDSDDVSKDDDKNPSFTLKDCEEEEEHDKECVQSLENYESDDDKEYIDKETYDDLYKDVDVKSLRAEHEMERKGDAELTNTTHESASQETSYGQIIEDAHVTLTYSQKTEGSKQSSYVSFDFASKFLNLDNVPPVIDEVASLLNVKTHLEELSTQLPPILSVPVTTIPKTSTVDATAVPPLIQPFSSIPQMTTPTPVPTTKPTTTSIAALLDFSTLFGFDQRVSTLEKEIYATRTALQSYTKEFEKKAQEERMLYIDMVEKLVKDIIKNEVKSQLPQILPKEVSNFATPMIQSSIIESLENVVLAKSSSQPISTYEAAESLTEFKLKKILLDKLKKSKSYRGAKEHLDLYDALVKSYQLDKDLFESYGNTDSLKRDREDKDQDKDPPAGSNQGLKKRKTSKDVEPLKGSKSKESMSSSSKDTKSQPKLSGKSVQAEELVFETTDTEMLQDQGGDLGHEYPFDLSKPLLLIEAQGRQVVPTDYFFNNDLEYLKGRSSSRKYTTSTTKTKAAKYDNIEGIKDMVMTLWSPVKEAYEKFAMWGISHWVLNDKISMATQATGSPSMICSSGKESLQ
uniref:Retrovirus-related Pol polyprotein from transposon TNT 1-94 n=1 Tax=Tanacetum cinerariifolium TaxID=118510 RepID=A0A6L2JTN2_TANCI|nr:hypothetical protein [Tanacetum cinerariifolium]